MKRYKATTGINFRHKDGGKNEVRVEPGEYVEGMNDQALKNEIAAGNIVVEEQVIPEGQEGVTEVGNDSRVQN